jgi:hypothetical protein
MREQEAAIWIIEQGNRVFVRLRVAEAAVNFTKNPSIMEEQPFRSQPFVDHGKTSIGRCRRGVEAVAVANSRGRLRTIGCERTSATNPINELITAPTERADAGCVETELRKQNHEAS